MSLSFILTHFFFLLFSSPFINFISQIESVCDLFLTNSETSLQPFSTIRHTCMHVVTYLKAWIFFNIWFQYVSSYVWFQRGECWQEFEYYTHLVTYISWRLADVKSESDHTCPNLKACLPEGHWGGDVLLCLKYNLPLEDFFIIFSTRLVLSCHLDHFVGWIELSWVIRFIVSSKISQSWCIMGLKKGKIEARCAWQQF